MSLNKIPPLPGGEEVGYDLKLNVGCDALKCNTINGEPYPNPNGLVYQEPNDPSAPTNINAGAICFFQNNDDPKNVTKTDYAKFEPIGGFGGGQTLNCSNSLRINNCPSITTEVSDSKFNVETIADGTTGTNLSAQRRFDEGIYIYSAGGALLPTTANVNAISLSDEQIARDTTYFYKFVCDNVGLLIIGSASVSPPFYPFRGGNYGISPALNECIEVVYVFSKTTNEWVRCKQTI